MKRWLWLIPLVVLLLLLLRPHLPQMPRQAENVRQTLGFSNSLAGDYLASRFSESSNDPEKAGEYLTRALKKDPGNLALLEHSFKMKMLAGKMDQAIGDAENFHALQPQSFVPAMMLAVAAIHQGDYVKADDILKSIMASSDADEQRVNALLLPIIRAWVLVGQGRYPDARALMETVESHPQLENFLTYQKALMADVSGMQKDAAKAYEELLKDGVVRSYRLVEATASFYLRIGRREKAEGIIAAFNAEHPTLPVKLLKEPPITDAAQGVAEFMIETASLLYSRRLDESAIVYLNLALYLRPDLSYAQFLLGTIMESRKSYAQAIHYLRMLQPGDLFYEEAQGSIARNLQKSGDEKEAQQFLKERLRRNPKDLEALSMLGDIYLSAKNYKQAAETYTKVLEAGDTAGKERWSWFFARGIAYERLGEWAKAEPDLTKALELQPDHPEVLNYLAYSWIIAGKNIDKAKDMLKMALASRPNDANILDSYGWALFALKQYDEAAPYIERAALMMPGDPTVNDHLGDVYWRLGREREAKFQWERALIFKPEPKEAQKIQHKLEHGLENANPGAGKN